MEATFGAIALTGPTIPEHLSSWEMPTRAEVDVVQGVRAAFASPRPRGNRETAVTLKLRRDKGTYLQAAAASARFAAALPAQAMLTLREVSGGSEVIIAFVDACFASCQPRRDGVGCVIELAFVTGRPATVAESEIPEVRATWGTWHAATWGDLNSRKWIEQQLAA